MYTYFKMVLGTALLASSVLSASFASAQEIKERTIKLALANTPESAHGLGAKRFADVVSQKSGGKLKVRVYAGGTLGGEVVIARVPQYPDTNHLGVLPVVDDDVALAVHDLGAIDREP